MSPSSAHDAIRVTSDSYMCVSESPRFQEMSMDGHYTDLCSNTGLQPSIPCQVVSQGLSLASGFEHPASTLPTRFPAALGIGHVMPAA